jgi:hypothetical protein
MSFLKPHNENSRGGGKDSSKPNCKAAHETKAEKKTLACSREYKEEVLQDLMSSKLEGEPHILSVQPSNHECMACSKNQAMKLLIIQCHTM